MRFLISLVMLLSAWPPSTALFDHTFDRCEGEEIEERFSAGRDLFSSQPACVGFVAAAAIVIFGRPGAEERMHDEQVENFRNIQAKAAVLLSRISELSGPEIGTFLDFQTLNEILVNKKVGKHGDYQREFFLKAFQTLFEEKFDVQSMTPCWRAY